MSLASLFPVLQWFDDVGDPLDSGNIFTYAAGTTTALATYADALYISLNANPVPLDSTGRAVMFLLPQAYKFIVKNSANVQVGPTYDNIQLQGAGDLTVTPIVTAYTATYDDDVVVVTSGGPFTITLPTALNHTGKVYTFKNLTANAITVDGNGAETIDGAATFILNTQNESLTIWSDGTNWKILANFV